ncbi:hypothetical protein TSOC_012608 [Tetrabaena socialis]|uniref:Uncharacterized protein n=1 Tax=Tetrabaena socialis TaxID=47790 RepID=A0A2J7ZMM1_9CHLO|nr:hypothetical protein TSOC_012608 [Tetrabaena socialis]|eukprot:PNH01500.1 hypothetical protein TSOC_012608 [Tetrabaena socialis]
MCVHLFHEDGCVAKAAARAAGDGLAAPGLSAVHTVQAYAQRGKLLVAFVLAAPGGARRPPAPQLDRYWLAAATKPALTSASYMSISPATPPMPSSASAASLTPRTPRP